MIDFNKKNKENFDENDAILFNLLVDVYTAKKYEQYTEQDNELKQELCFDESPELDDRCISAIRKEYKKNKHSQMCKKAFMIMQKVSVAVLTIVLLCALVVAASPTAQANVLKFFTIEKQNYTTIKVNTNNDPSKPDSADNNADVSSYTLPPAPEGFTLVSEFISERSHRVIYDGQDNSSLTLSIAHVFNGSYNIDTRNAEVSRIELNGLEGLYYEKMIPGSQKGTMDNRKSITLINSDLGIYITAFGINVEKDVLVSYVEQIEFVG